ncbi:MAG: SMI1/KNR4 family protein [Kastovskya adunca ATA6-11-RM4]|nr:SMI1/KNR4 family protein [Kastovskya adunca ATA6-11-RM4]
MGEAATQEEVDQCEQELSVSLPPSYRKFLLKYNGAHLFCSHTGNRSTPNSWWADSGIIIFGTKSLLEYRQLVYKLLLLDTEEYPTYPSSLPIAYLGRIGTGDFCALDMDELIAGENPVLDCDHEYPPSEWKNAMIAVSLEDWLQKMFARVVEHKSPPEYWFEDTLEDNSLVNLMFTRVVEHKSPPEY